MCALDLGHKLNVYHVYMDAGWHAIVLPELQARAGQRVVNCVCELHVSAGNITVLSWEGVTCGLA